MYVVCFPKDNSEKGLNLLHMFSYTCIHISAVCVVKGWHYFKDINLNSNGKMAGWTATTCSIQYGHTSAECGWEVSLCV